MPPQAFHAQEIGRTDEGNRVVRLAFELALEGAGGGDSKGSAPKRLHVVPAGPKVFARDGRSFRVNDPAKVIAASETPMLIDWEHMSEYGHTKAAGWVSSLEFVDAEDATAGIWGTVESWTPQGEADVSSKAYRYLSPVLVIDAMTEEVVSVVSVALTNKPALRLEALDSFRQAMSRGGLSIHAAREAAEETDTMLKKLLCAALALGEDVADEAIVAKVESFKKAGDTGESISLQAYTAVVHERNAFKERLDAAEGKLASLERESFRKNVEAEVDKHIAEGFLTPAEREAELARIESAQDLERATFAWQKRPKLAASTDPKVWEDAQGASKTQVQRSTDAFALTDEHRKELKRMGLTEDAFTAAAARQNQGK